VRPTGLLAWLTAALCLAATDAVVAQAPAHSTCQPSAQPKAVTDAQAALDRAPDQLSPRLRLADALIDQGCYQEAVAVLDAGRSTHPRSSELLGKLRDARSMVSEENYIRGLGEAEERAKLQRNLLRCSQLADLAACDDALRAHPDDLQSLLAKADALQQKNRPGDAQIVYRRAAELNPGNDTLKAKLIGAELQRQTMLARCQTDTGAGALEACDGALVRGGDDEYIIQRRKGMLLQSLNQPGSALDAYIAAGVLKHDDPATAQAVVTLTDSTGRKDAMTLAARGSALLTLDRPADALRAFREAQALAPALPAIEAQVNTAEKLARLASTTKLARVTPAHVQATPVAAAGRGAIKETQPAPLSAAREPASPARTYSNDAPAGHSN